MLLNRHQNKTRFAIIVGTILALSLITVLFGLAHPLLRTQAQATLPPLDPPTATPGPSSGGSDGESAKDDKGGPLIAHIELQASTAPVGAWSVVQWQDSSGNWHDVEGWRSALPGNGLQRWAVEAKDFNTGPFRWLVRQGQTGGTSGVSTTFNLPTGANETLRVLVN